MEDRTQSKEEEEEEAGEEEDRLGYNWVLEVFPADEAGEGELLLTVTAADLILLHIWGGRG